MRIGTNRAYPSKVCARLRIVTTAENQPGTNRAYPSKIRAKLRIVTSAENRHLRIIDAQARDVQLMRNSEATLRS